MPIILIGIAVSIFFTLANPMYNEISALKLSAASYDTALENSKMLENERDKLTAKYNAISPDDLIKLKKLLPDNVDNIRLILEIEQIALPYGMVLKDVKYSTINTNTKTAETVAGGGSIQGGVVAAPEGYGAFDLEFSTSGTYDNFIAFTKALESNLRIVDISSISFSSDTGNSDNKNKTFSPEIYKYDFKIKTYYIKN